MRAPSNPRQVEALAAECAALLRWLESTSGSSASPDEYARTLAAYNALRRAITLLPRGSESLKRQSAVPRPWRPQQVQDSRRAEDITADEIAMLQKPVLTATGWVVPDESALTKRVDRVRAELREQERRDTNVDALEVIVRRVARARGRSEVRAVEAKNMARLKTRLTRERQRMAAVTGGTAKVPPENGPA